MKILLISDIHANFPALQAVDQYLRHQTFDRIINCGDSLVYAPFPNETLDWLKKNKCISILGNTDKKVIKLLRGRNFGKPRKPEKKIMYTWTAENLTPDKANHLMSFNKKMIMQVNAGENSSGMEYTLEVVHGSPAHHHEFLFDTTSDDRFLELSQVTTADIVLCGHSHVPFHKLVDGTHFINPGSIGRMFDGDPRASCAIIQCQNDTIAVEHFRIDYDIEATVSALRQALLPEVYVEMYRRGRKTN